MNKLEFKTALEATLWCRAYERTESAATADTAVEALRERMPARDGFLTNFADEVLQNLKTKPKTEPTP